VKSPVLGSKPRPARSRVASRREGWHGWDDYAAFYDWENARTLGRRDVAFWRALVRQARGPVLELGCGTGRLLAPVARAGVPVVGIDRSASMLALASHRLGRLPRSTRTAILRGDIRQLPLRPSQFELVIAGYGILQSLVRDRDLNAMLREAARVLRAGGLLGIDLVPDLPRWREYERRVSLDDRARTGRRIRLVESVRQDPRRGLTVFDEEFVVSRGRGRLASRHRFSLTFRTLRLDVVKRRLAKCGLAVEAVFGDYHGGPWTPDADTWLVMAR
jgi:SAM-dependent methyltransferase